MNLNNLGTDIKVLENSIEEMRTKLNNFITTNKLLLPDTVQLSQKLDELIIQYYKAN